MATNCPQLLKPRACRSALCFRTAASKPVREMSCKICEKMLHTLFKAESSSDSFCFCKLNLSETLSLLLPGDAQHSGVNLDEDDVTYLTMYRHTRHFPSLSNMAVTVSIAELLCSKLLSYSRTTYCPSGAPGSCVVYSADLSFLEIRAPNGARLRNNTSCHWSLATLALSTFPVSRSEERRVGKECRSRW